jgi:serine phosphatase RsbU (regulator of sigma subunit)
MDGTLTVGLGDATGHGMKAGTMVTIAKSLFNSLASEECISSTFSKMSRVIKDMKLRQLSMCLMLLKIKGTNMYVSSAAIPPAYLYRDNTQTVEEIFLKGMPLGAMKDFSYPIKEYSLQQDDTIMMLSDGLPELLNENEEMYGYDRIRSEFLSIGQEAPETIVDHFRDSAAQWANGRDADDDVTFVVIKVKN